MLKRITLVACGTGAAVVFLQRRSVNEHKLEDYKEHLLQRAGQANAAIATLCRTFRDTSAAVLTRSETASSAWAGSLAGQLAEWAEDQSKQYAVVLLGGRPLLEWLLDSAVNSQKTDDQANAERAIISFLNSGAVVAGLFRAMPLNPIHEAYNSMQGHIPFWLRLSRKQAAFPGLAKTLKLVWRPEATASLLLQQDGAVPRLLQMVGQSSNVAEAADALCHAARTVSFADAPSLDDIRQTVQYVSSSDGPWVQLLAVQFLGNWADTAVVNCGKIAAMKGGPALAAALERAIMQPAASAALQRELLHTMAVLARDCPLRSRLGLNTWLQPLLVIAADAAAEERYALAAQALDTFTASLHQGSSLRGSLAATNAMPLLRQLASDSNPLLRRAVVTSVAALAAPQDDEASLLPASQIPFWQSRLLRWVCEAGEDHAACANAATALQALAQAPSSQGMLVAADWLGELLCHLARDAQAYHTLHAADPGQGVTESVYASTVAVLPAHARGMAAELRSLWEPPEEVLGDADTPLARLRPPQPAMPPVDAFALDSVLCSALKVLCALVSSSDDKQRWLYSAGIMPLLQSLTLDRSLTAGQEVNARGEAELSPCVQRQVARLLAMVTAHMSAQQMRVAAWEAWLKEAARSRDCKLSSHATRALLHLRSARAAAAARLQDPFAGVAQASSQPAPDSPDAQRLVYRDGVNLFSPLAEHHRVLAEHGSAAQGPGAPLLDVVFVHGIRGGPFASWREWVPIPRPPAAVLAHKAASVEDKLQLEHESCWPSCWLAADLPQARLLSMEYAAPASGWEGESLPLWGTVEQLTDRLTAAGIGQRPVVFVAHSMGGILVKELLVKAGQAGAPEHHKKLAAAVAGLVFYSTPHMGSWLAAWGWSLRWLGASPAASVLHLRPGPHLEAVNEVLRARHARGDLPVLSFGEGQTLSIGNMLPHMLVVPPEAAYPGYGEFVLLRDADHISTCKPRMRSDLAYVRTHAFLQGCAEQATQEPGTGWEGDNDGQGGAPDAS